MSTATADITNWLGAFEKAVSSGDFKAAAAMFGADSYWRDLVSFTWNIKTAEGPAEIEAMMAATMPAQGLPASPLTAKGARLAA